MGNTVSSPSGVESPLYDRQTFPRTEKKLVPKVNTIERSDTRNQASGNQENSRMLFLMYLLNRTWNVVVDGKGGKRWVLWLQVQQTRSTIAWPKMKLKPNRGKVSKRWRIWHGFHFRSVSRSSSLVYLQTISFVWWFQRWWNDEGKIFGVQSQRRQLFLRLRLRVLVLQLRLLWWWDLPPQRRLFHLRQVSFLRISIGALERKVTNAFVEFKARKLAKKLGESSIQLIFISSRFSSFLA